jgi:hypothetical protein
MARLTFFALASAVALAVISGGPRAVEAEGLALPNILPDHAPGALDDNGDPIVFFMGSGDTDDDDINDGEIARECYGEASEESVPCADSCHSLV